MGVVYAATDTVLHNRVAVKLLNPQEDQADNAVERFEREARATAKLGHPNIVRVSDMGRTDDGGAFIVMEVLTGETLDELLAREGPLSVDRAVRIHLQLLDALSAAHAENVLHRDVKPSNVFLSKLADGGELVKLLDFGLAYLMEEASSKRLTATGIAMGTPAYMSPERITGERLDHRSDIYSVGVSLFRSLTGELPFHADTPMALRGRILLVEAPVLSDSRPELGGTIADVVAKALAKKPEDRFADATEMAHALREAFDQVRPSRTDLPLVKLEAKEVDDAFRDAPTRATKDTAASDEPLPADDEPEAKGEPDAETRPQRDPSWQASTIQAGSQPGLNVVAPPSDPKPATPAPAPAKKPGPPRWLAGVAIGAAIGVVLLLGLYLWAMSRQPDAPTPPANAPPAAAPR